LYYSAHQFAELWGDTHVLLLPKSGCVAPSMRHEEEARDSIIIYYDCNLFYSNASYFR
jgi:hypothetical protein